MGEDYHSLRIRTNGEPPHPVSTGVKDHFCGRPEAWNGEATTASDPPLLPDVFGNSTCCSKRPAGIPDACGRYGFASPTYFARVCIVPAVPPGTSPLLGLFAVQWDAGKSGWVTPMIDMGGLLAYWKWYSPPGLCTARVGLFSAGGVPLIDALTNVTPWDRVSEYPDFGPIAEFGLFGELTATISLNPLAPCPEVDDDMIVGTLFAYAGPTLPAKCLLCDGSAVSRTTYADLFAAIGVTWGPGDGSTTFNLPDLRGRVLVGASGAFPLASTGGEATHTLTTPEIPSHTHNLIDTGHVHPADTASGNLFLEADGSTVAGANGGDFTTYNAITANSQTDPAFTGMLLDSTGGSGPHNNLQPYAAARPLIFAGV